MQEKVIYYNNLAFVLDESTGYYLNSTLRIRLHRYVWLCERGDIPKGYEIHHIDFDRSNNDISNLACITRAEHRRIHADALTSEQREWKRQNLELNARPKAIEWHKSEAGLEWHRTKANTSAMHIKVSKVCANCGCEYVSVGHSKFCSNKCKVAYRRKSGLNNVTRVCEICGNEFVTDRYKSTTTCSRQCSAKLGYKRIRQESSNS